jgi:hypothetical protein
VSSQINAHAKVGSNRSKLTKEFGNNYFAEHGGAKQLDKILVNLLDVVLDELSEAL